MKIVHIFIALFALSFLLGEQANAVEVVPSPPPPLASSALLVTEFRTSNNLIDYIQLYNNSSDAVFLPDWKLVNTYGDGRGVFEVALPEAYLPPGRYIVLSADSAMTGPLVYPLGSVEEFTAQDSFSLVSVTRRFAPEPVPIATSEQGMRYHRYKSSAGNYTATRTFSKLSSQSSPLLSDELYTPRMDFPLVPVEILPNARNCSPRELDTACGDYVKFYNHTEEIVDFTGVRLRIGYQGQNISETNAIALGGSIQPGEYAVFSALPSGAKLSLANSGAFVWLEDSYGVVRYENTVIEYPDASSKKGRSWAVNSEGNWDWATPHPMGPNIHDEPEPPKEPPLARELVPCQPDQFRNPETNRCNKIAAPAVAAACTIDQERNPETGRCRKLASQDGPKPCAADQERNPDTGRCRKITSSASSLTPCKPGQERNLETNRCRSVQQAAASLKPCAPGQERNPQTNRCRAIKSTPIQSDFTVEAVKSSRDTIASWWALGGVGSLALGYAGWEWRTELLRSARRVRELLLHRR